MGGTNGGWDNYASKTGGKDNWGLGLLCMRQLGVGTTVCKTTGDWDYCVWDNRKLGLLCVGQQGLGLVCVRQLGVGLTVCKTTVGWD